MSHRELVDSMLVQLCETASRHWGSSVERTDRIVNRTLSVLLAVAIGFGLAWWLWEWAGQCAELLTCGMALVRPHPSGSAAATNEERLHIAVSAAHKAGEDAGYCAGFKAGARYGRVLHIGAGMVLGAALVAVMLKLGFVVGAGA
jgi:hypothetical protein